MHGTPFVELVNRPLSRLSDSPDMTQWQVIEEALSRMKPRRGMKWLADELGEKIQVVSNWKARGVPPRRFREIAKVLGLSVDQLEGVEPVPWDRGEVSEFLPEVHKVAASINQLTPAQRAWVLDVTTKAIGFAKQAVASGANTKSPVQQPTPSERMKKAS